MDTVPLSLAFAAGGLAVLNPCGVALLPAFLSFYATAPEGELPRAPSRLAQGLLVGLLVTAGFLGVFSLVGLPVSYGAGVVARAVPLAGLALGLVLLAVGLLTLGGRQVVLPWHAAPRLGDERRARTVVLFGAGYGVASLSCTLPVFLTLVGASLAARGPAASVGVFGAYGAGAGAVLMALSIAAALVREGLARRLRRLLPHLPKVTGALLVVAGAYLSYYWWRVGFGPKATLASDPLVGPVTMFTARLRAWAEGVGSALVLLAGLVVGAGAVVAWWQWRRRSGSVPSSASAPAGRGGGED